LLLQQHQQHQQQQQLQQQQQQHVALDGFSATLANLKKQRSLSRTANVLNNFELSSQTTSNAHTIAAATATATATTTNGSVLGAGGSSSSSKY